MIGEKMSFEQLMAAGVEAQARDAHEEALGYRHYAYFQACEDGNVLGKARALRDGAASHSKLDQLAEAEDAANLSLDELADLGSECTTLNRELGASYDRLGRVMARIAIKEELRGGRPYYDAAKRRINDGWRFIRYSEKQERSMRSRNLAGNWQWPGCVDQYRINMAKDKVVVDALDRSGFVAAFIGTAKAIGLGALSESVLINHSNPNLSIADRLKTHVKYTAAGLYAGILAAGLHVRPLRSRALQRADALLR
jgi:hypothetical protein